MEGIVYFVCACCMHTLHIHIHIHIHIHVHIHIHIHIHIRIRIRIHIHIHIHIISYHISSLLSKMELYIQQPRQHVSPVVKQGLKCAIHGLQPKSSRMGPVFCPMVLVETANAVFSQPNWCHLWLLFQTAIFFLFTNWESRVILWSGHWPYFPSRHPSFENAQIPTR